MPIAGRLIDLYLAAPLFIAAALALGLLISTIAQTQFQAIQMAFVTCCPRSCCRASCSRSRDAPCRGHLAQVLPLTHFNEIIRGITLRGATLRDMWCRC